MSEAMVSMFGDSLTSKTGSVATKDALKDKFVMVYFSAHWCPPCRGFTPILSEFYKNVTKDRNDVELVFVSSDKDEAQFTDYYSEMPWMALPFAERSLKATLSKKFKVSGIPALIVLDKDGSLITDKGRDGVTEDPTAAKFPWFPPKLKDIWPSKFQTTAKDDGKKELVDASSLSDKYVLCYFSAHWCPPCKAFTPRLAEFYKKFKETRDDFEIVFVSSDRDEGAFNEYYGEMPWMAIPFAERNVKNDFSKYFGVSGIPSLVVLDKEDADGNRATINGSANGEIEEPESFPWFPRPFADLVKTANCGSSDINDDVSFIVICENEDDDEQDSIVDTLKKTAEGYKQEEGKSILFFYAKESKGLVERLKKMCKLEGVTEGITFLKIDIPDKGAFYVKKDVEEVSEESIKEFIANSGERLQLS